MSRKPGPCGSPDPMQLAGRRLSCATIMFHQAVADRLGLNVTDHKCLDFLLLDGPLTAGDLAQRTSLTTGAITAVVDRLEKAGFVQRQPDPSDRRRVIVHPVMERIGQVGALFFDLGSQMQKLSSQYTQSELDLIITFMHRSSEVLLEAAKNLQLKTVEPASLAK